MPLKLSLPQEAPDDDFSELEDCIELGDIDPSMLEKVEDLGEGAGGSVAQFVDRRNGRVMAVKKIKPHDGSKRVEIRKELVALLNSDCPELIKLYGAFMDSDDCMNICLEYMDMGSVMDVLEAVGKIPETILAHIIAAVLRSLNFLHHDRHFMHRDLKPSNILVSSEGRIKLTDFGVGGELEDTLASTRTFVGTVYYMAPERLMAKSYTSSVDIWSLGLMIIQCATGVMPFQGLTYWQLNQKLQDEPPPTLASGQGFTDEMRHFVELCLRKDGAERPSAAQLLQHLWIKGSQPSDPARFQTYYCNWLRWANSKIQQRRAETRNQGASSTEDLLAQAFD